MNNHKLFILSLIIFVDSIAIGIIYPIIPQLISDHYLILSDHLAAKYITITISIFFLGNFFGMPIIGRMSDIFGKEKLLLLGLIGMCLSYGLMLVSLYSLSFVTLLMGRFFTGFFSSTIVIAEATVSDISKTMNAKLLSFKWISISATLGYILGPMLGGTSAFFDQSIQVYVPFVIAIILCLLNIILLFSTSSSSNVDKHSVITTNHNACSRLDLSFSKNIKIVFISFLCFQFSFAIILQTIPIMLSLVFDFTTAEISIYYTLIAVMIVIGLNTIKLRSRSKQSFKQSFLKLLSASFLLLFLLLILFMCFSWILSIILIIPSLIYILFPIIGINFNTYVSSLSNESNSGTTMGILGLIYAISWFIGSLASGFVINYFPLLLSVSMFFLFSSICLIYRALSYDR